YAIPVTGAAPTRKGDMTEDLGYGWQGDLIDLPAYLKRIGHDGGLDPTPQTLRALHRAHVTSIPFENLEIMVGRPVELSLDAVQAKLVGGPRGGYCFEHNRLFAGVLERLGYEIVALARSEERRVGEEGGSRCAPEPPQ